MYELDPYNAHLSTLNRTLNEEDNVYVTANTDGYSAEISVSLVGDSIADGIIGYITVGINSTAADMITTGGSINSIGVIPTVSVESAFFFYNSKRFLPYPVFLQSQVGLVLTNWWNPLKSKARL